MTDLFQSAIAAALGPELAGAPVTIVGHGALPSYFATSALALASVAAAAGELAALTGARATLDRRLVLAWFGMTLRPEGWKLPAAWDPIAGDYRAADGWIRLHTNAPRHRQAALSVLGGVATPEAVAAAVAGWSAAALEAAVVAAGGGAAAMHSLADWAAHPQGRAVAAEPLIAWDEAAPAGRKAARLEGLKLLDLTRVLAGPVATRFLAGFGVQVLRIDPPDWSEPGVEPEVTLGKRCTGLDLNRRADRQVFEAKLAEADVLVHGYRPGALEGLGYGSERRRALNPGLIEASLSAYGWTGPWGGATAGRRGFDSLVQMSAGIAAEGMVRAGAGRPVPLPMQALDHATGYLIAAAVLRALRLRQQTGRLVSARLSLARTAALLTAAGAHAPEAEPPAPETPADLAPELEATPWGPARRLRFPLCLDGAGPVWRAPAGPLRRHPPEW